MLATNDEHSALEFAPHDLDDLGKFSGTKRAGPVDVLVEHERVAVLREGWNDSRLRRPQLLWEDASRPRTHKVSAARPPRLVLAAATLLARTDEMLAGISAGFPRAVGTIDLHGHAALGAAVAISL